MEEKEVLKLIEAAYREGLRKGSQGQTEIRAYLVTSQIAAYEIYRKLILPNR